MLQGINALQYAHLDIRLSKDDWLRLKEQENFEAKDKDSFGETYSMRIIDDALEIWPNRRIVD